MACFYFSSVGAAHVTRTIITIVHSDKFDLNVKLNIIDLHQIGVFF